MSDLISREDLIDWLTSGIIRLKGIYGDLGGAVSGVREIVKVMPSAEPERTTFHVIDRQTGREADPYDIALNEDWAKGLMYCDMEGFALLEDGTLILTDECGRYEFPPDSDRFEIVWDCGAEMKK